jgi:general secretion pathway protein E
VEGAGADFQVERLDQHAALSCPVGVEALDELLEGNACRERRGGVGHAARAERVQACQSKVSVTAIDRVPWGMPMESRADAGAPVARIELPPGRLVFEQVAMALLADGMVDPADAERLRFSAETMRHDGNIHPLVLLANLKLKAGIAPMGDLGLERLTEWLAARVGLRYLHVDPTRVDVSSVASLVTHAYARRHRILPLAVEPQRLLVATSEPLALEWVGDVRHMDANDQHIVNIVDWLLAVRLRAARQRHPHRAAPRLGIVRFRIDGVLHRSIRCRRRVTAMTSRIKILGRMDVAEKRRPQDGRIKTRTPAGSEVELRLSTLPTAFGEKLVMRIFDPEVLVRDFAELGFMPRRSALGIP